jgi:hypothetical protein
VDQSKALFVTVTLNVRELRVIRWTRA